MKRTPALLVTTLLAALGLVLAGPVGLVGTASAAGTGDVELVPASPDGEPRTSFTVDTDQDSIRFELVNLADAPREARLYAASANRGEGGGVSVGAAGSAPWLQLPDAVIQLAPGEARTFTAPLDVAELPEGEQQLGAVVLEALQGSVTVRVATLVTVKPHAALPLPIWVIAIAAGAIALVLLGLWFARRREGEHDAAPVAADEPMRLPVGAGGR